MAESYVEVTEGTGKRLHTFEKTVGANTVHDEVMVLGEPVLANYSVGISGVGVDTGAEHLMQLMAGSSLPVYIRRISVYQNVSAASNAKIALDVLRLTTAGTGGTSVTPVKYDPSDAGAGATARVRPTAKGTESDILHRGAIRVISTPVDQQDWHWHQLPNAKPFIIPAGTNNGIAIKQLSGATDANATLRITIEFSEGYA